LDRQELMYHLAVDAHLPQFYVKFDA
jgi:hypothetical protein